MMLDLYQYKAELVRVVDGDTVVLSIDLGFHTWLRNVKCRLADCWAPELRDPGGLQSREELVRLCLIGAKDLQVRSLKPVAGDKYGRWLVTLFVCGSSTSINATMVKNGYAKSTYAELLGTKWAPDVLPPKGDQ